MKGISKKLLSLAFILSTTSLVSAKDPNDIPLFIAPDPIDNLPLVAPENQAAFRESVQQIGKGIEATINSGQEKAKTLVNAAIVQAAPVVSSALDATKKGAQTAVTNTAGFISRVRDDLVRELGLEPIESKQNTPEPTQQASTSPITDAQKFTQASTPAAANQSVRTHDKFGEIPAPAHSVPTLAESTSAITSANTTITAHTSVATSAQSSVQQTTTPTSTSWSETLAKPFKSAWSYTGSPACDYVSSSESYKSHPRLTITAIAAVGAASIYGICYLYKWYKNKPAQAATKQLVKVK